jgi:hypothetical protein
MTLDKHNVIGMYHIAKAKQGFNVSARADLYDQIAAKLDNGGDLQKLIGTLAKSAERFTPGSPTAFVLSYWTARMETGISFAKVVREHDFVPPVEVLLIAAGAEAGKLPDTLRVASTMLDTQGELKEAYVSAIFMPVVLVAGSIGVSAYFGTSVIPIAIDTYDKNLFTGEASALIQYSDFLVSPGGPITGVAVIGFIVWTIWSLNRTLGEGGFRNFLENYPPWNMYKELQSYAFLSTLAALLSVHSDRDALIYMCGDKQGDWQPTPYLLQRLQGAVGAFNGQGAANVADALEKSGYNFPSANILSLLYEYADVADFAGALQKQADRLRGRMLRQALNQGRKLNLYGYLVAFGLLMGLFVGFFELSDQISAIAKRS